MLGAARAVFLANATPAAAAGRTAVTFTATNGAAIDTAQYKFGGSSLELDGTNDYVSQDTQTFAPTDFTVEAWVRIDSNPSGNYPIYATDDFMLTIAAASGGYYRFQFYDGSSNVILASAFNDLNTWHHIAVSRSGSSLKGFVDGTQVGSTATWSNTVSSTANYVGYSGGLGGNTYFNGHIDELRVSNSARYTANFTPDIGPHVNDDDTFFLLHFDGTDASTTITDDTGDAATFRTDSYASNVRLALPFDSMHEAKDMHTVINTSSTALSTFSRGSTVDFNTDAKKWSTPDYEFSADFNDAGGSTKALTYALTTSMPSSNSGSNTFVVECWVKAQNSTSNSNWAISSADSGGRWLFGINSSSTITFGGENNIGVGDSTNWHHLAIVLDSGTKRFYLDGIYKGAWYSTNTGFTTMHIGQFNASDANDYIGYMQDFKITIGSNRGYTGTSTSSANFTLPSSIVESY